MARMVYARGKHYQSVQKVKLDIEELWATVVPELLLTL